MRWECKETQRKSIGETRQGRGERGCWERGVHHALDTLDLNFVSIWVPAPESNPSDVKGEGTRKNNMEITWTVSVPQPSL